MLSLPLQLLGAPELVIGVLALALSLALYLGVPLFLAYLVYSFMDGKNSYDERIRELEREVEELGSRLD